MVQSTTPVHESTTPVHEGITPFGPFSLRWEETGSGPPVLLLHGIYAGAGRHEWSELAPRLAVDHRVRSADLLGCGDSDHPDLGYDQQLVLDTVRALIRDAVDVDGRPPVVVASSLTAAYAVRAVASGTPVARLVLVTPTGLGRAQTRTSRFGSVAYAVGRHSPVGDALTWALTSRPSIAWFLAHQAFDDPDLVTADMVEEHHRVGRAVNAKHATMAFVANQLVLPLSPSEVQLAAPQVIWGEGQRFVDADEPARWRQAGATVEIVGSGLPHREQPGLVAATVTTPLRLAG